MLHVDSIIQFIWSMGVTT
uniref:Uncharacterized protein n=1 Tax=Arundo donax TaxID=35708 RepID=A0A0A9HK59_ARUDO